MRFALTVALAAHVLAGAGCTNAQLRQSTVNQASTLTDLQYRMVLENLAQVTTNPAALPWHVNINTGAAQVADTGQALFGVGVNLYRLPRANFTNISPATQLARTVVQQWGLNPVTDGDALRLLRIAYRRARGIDEMPGPDLLDDVAHDLKKMIVSTDDLRSESYLFYRDLLVHEKLTFEALSRDTDSTVGDRRFLEADTDPARHVRASPLAREVAHQVNDIVDDLRSIGPGWYGVGRRRDVPRDARYVAHDGPVYVWVCASGMEGLTRFTLAVLDIATALDPPQFGGQQGGVNYSPGFDTSF